MSQLQIFIEVKYGLKLLKSLKRSNFVPSHFYAYFAKYFKQSSVSRIFWANFTKNCKKN